MLVVLSGKVSSSSSPSACKHDSWLVLRPTHRCTQILLASYAAERVKRRMSNARFPEFHLVLLSGRLSRTRWLPTLVQRTNTRWQQSQLGFLLAAFVCICGALTETRPLLVPLRVLVCQTQYPSSSSARTVPCSKFVINRNRTCAY